jgi:serine/threonine protein kinase
MKLGQPVTTEALTGNRNVPADQASYAGLRPSDLLDGRFRIVEMINRGGMATVFKAEDLQDHGQPVGIKVPHAKYATGLGAWSRSEREEEIGSQLSHPAVLRYVSVPGRPRGSYIVTEYLQGETLADRLKRNRPLPEPEALDIARRVAEALQFLHEHGVVHYDLKPGNVILCADGSIRLLDFGLAQPVETRRFSLHATTPAMGTTAYIAPEQLQGKHGRPSADIYGLGAMLYEMLTATAPFPDDDPTNTGSQRLTGDPVAPRKLNSTISPQAEEIVLRALQRDPSHRYPSAAAMKADLAAPRQVRVTCLCDRLLPSTRWKCVLLKARWIALVCVLPIAVQAVLYFWIWYRYSRRR